MVIWIKILKTEKTIELELVRQTEACGKVRSEKTAYKSVKTPLLLSYVFDAYHQNSCLITNKGHFSSPIWVSLVFPRNFISNTLPIALTRVLECI